MFYTLGMLEKDAGIKKEKTVRMGLLIEKYIYKLFYLDSFEKFRIKNG